MLRPLRYFTLALLCGLILACGNESADDSSQPALRVVTRNAPTTYYIDKDKQPAGPEYDLVMAFAANQNRQVTFILEDTVAGVLQTLADGKADIAAAGLGLTDERQSRFLFTRSYRKGKQQLVCRRGAKKARSIGQLQDISLEVIADSTYIARLEKLKLDYPELKWTVNYNEDTEQLLQKVWRKRLDCTIADSNIVAVNRRYLPELLVMFDIQKDGAQAWALPKDATGLKRAFDRWLASGDGQSTLRTIEQRYYSYIDKFDYVDTRALVRRIEQRLPKYRKLFEQAGAKHGIDPTLLMAQSYQESHWKPKAASPTGVKGIMMLTRNTARSLGVKNRLDPKEAIPAGAAYLAKMRSRFKDTIPEPDRSYLALAAYNIGRAHMHDAQTLARQLGKNPHRWQDMESVLPLLSDKRYYKKLKYGYARGIEPVRYVQRIRNYQNIIGQKLGK